MNIQHLEVNAGEDRTLMLYGRDASNAASNLTGKTIAVYVGRPPNNPRSTTSVLTKTGTIVSASAGSFSIDIANGDTDNLTPGDYQYVAETTTSGGLIAVVTRGRFRILSTITS
jgi:hypothetical protein